MRPWRSPNARCRFVQSRETRVLSDSSQTKTKLVWRRSPHKSGERERPNGPSPLEETCPARTVLAALARRGDARVHRLPLLAAAAELPDDARRRQAAVGGGAPAPRPEASARAAARRVGHGAGRDARGSAPWLRRAR